MERKTTQRIIGILVIAALIVILLPLLFNGNSSESPKLTAEVKVPPFPEQVPQSATDTNLAQQASAASQPTPDVNPQPSTDIAQSSPITPPAQDTNNNLNTNTVSMNDPLPTQIAEATPSNIQDTIVIPDTQKSDVSSIQEKPIVSKNPPHIEKIKLAKSGKPQLTHHDLVKLKNSAWVVQMGSFKNKTNAIRLTNQLRAQGYKAFTREIRSTLRVYVGPEFKQASAATLANKIEQQMKLRGIIISYKPLEL